MERDEQDEEEIVCLDESFFINDKSLSLSLYLFLRVLNSLLYWLLISSTMMLKLCSYQLTNFTFGSQVIQLFCLHSASSKLLLLVINLLPLCNFIRLETFDLLFIFIFCTMNEWTELKYKYDNFIVYATVVSFCVSFLDGLYFSFFF